MKRECKNGQKLSAEIKRICNFLSLRVSYSVLMVLLAIASAIQIVRGVSVESFLLLVVGIVIPVFANHLGNSKKESGQYVLTMLIKKYGYTDVKHQSLSNAFLVELLLLLLWQYASNRQPVEHYIISIMPVVFIIIFVGTRLVCYFSYQLLIKYKLKYNYL